MPGFKYRKTACKVKGEDLVKFASLVPTGAACEIGQIVEIGDSKLALDVRGKDFGWFVFVFKLSRVISIRVN